MTRWQPDARGRLQRAALELYAERGFDNTTVAEIAERAGLTERTFFRHFSDKREVLFTGSSALERTLVAAVADAPDTLTPMEAIAAGLVAGGALLPDSNYAGRRQTIIAANPDLQERELIKFASMSAALAGALRERGVGDLAASLAAETGMAVFRIAFEQWIDEANRRDFPDLIRESVDQLIAVTTAGR